MLVFDVNCVDQNVSVSDYESWEEIEEDYGSQEEFTLVSDEEWVLVSDEGFIKVIKN